MNKKIISVFVLFVLMITLVAAAQQNFGETITSGNILFLNTAENNPSSAITGWYPVEEWEVETCTRDVTASFTGPEDSKEGAFSPNRLIVDMTITMQAFRQDFALDPDYKEYEVAWYIHPFNESVTYEIQYKTTDWNSFDTPIQREAGPAQGDMGYYTWSLNENVSTVRIVANDGSYLEVPVVPYE